MNFKSMYCIGAACLALSAPSWAGTSAAASIYDLTFRTLSRQGYEVSAPAFGPGSPEATIVQARAEGIFLGHAPDPVAGSELYAPLAVAASVQEGGLAWTTANSGPGRLSVAGGTDISSEHPEAPVSMFFASASLNQDYGGVTTFGGWFTLAPMTSAVMSGLYDLRVAIDGPPCGLVTCSTAFAGITLGLGETLEMPFVAVDGIDGSSFNELTGQAFSLSVDNFTDAYVDVFFQTAVDIFGSRAAGIAAPVPEPNTLVMLMLGLGLVGMSARRGRASEASRPAAT